MYKRISEFERHRRQAGLTLIELMIVLAILSIISAIAIPFYTDYIDTSRRAALANNIATMEAFQEDFRLRNGAYQAGVFDGGSDADLLLLGWAPQADDGTTYTIVLDGGSYKVTAASTDGVTICRQLPEKIECP